MKAFVKAISYYLPAKVVSNTDLCLEFPASVENDIFKKTGIQKRHISGPKEFGSDMGVSSSEIFFKEHKIQREEIDFLIYCSETFDYRAPATACIIHERLGLNKNCGAIDIPFGCTGFTYSLSIAKALIESGQAKTILLINSDTTSKVIHPNDLDLRMLFGDASATTLICSTENDDASNVGNFVFGTDGSGAENLIVKRSASRDAVDIAWMEEHKSVGGMPYGKMQMNALEIFTFALRVVPTMVDEILKKNNLTIEEIDLFVFHQANAFLLSVLRRKLKIKEDRFFIYMKEVGNTVSSSIPIALYEAMKEGKAKKGNKILVAGFGIGYSWSGTVIVL